ncbi:Protein NRT1/ PTR FAMILY 8.5 [Rhynchospora pubera]|uniref:Protein NRT1/ PTR FAMILY 8.5 n=1 Tax=Rhynchospora pubera TaxID=906938 RepID=A0AAV8C5U5_9POAL|nr:Protein NRT1/ PTR FAMILY 8.5 [Rhynchospora pubera]
MEDSEERLLVLEEHTLSEDVGFTGDGSMDKNGNPVLKHNTGNWRACSFILWTECCERFAYYGISKSLVTYLKTRLHQGNVTAAWNFTTWQGTCYLTPLVGAVLADSWWGRYRTIAVFSAIYLIGMAILTISSSLSSLQPSPQLNYVSPQPNFSQYLLFFTSLYMIAIGAGGIKPCVSAFGADQFDETDPIERSNKGSFFNWFYFCINLGSLAAGTVLVYLQQYYGWGLGYGVPTLFMGLAMGSFFIGSKIYRFQKPGGSPITRVCQVLVASVRKWRVQFPLDNCCLYELPGKNSAIEGSCKLAHTDQLRFLDKAAVVTHTDSKHGNFSNPWRLCTVTQVEELKLLLRMFPIWFTGIVFFMVCAQDSSSFIEQGMVLKKQIGSFTIAPASLSTFEVLTFIAFVPIYDKIIVPVARRFTGKVRGFTELQRMGTGLILSILAMVSAALVETKRLQIAREMGLVHVKVEVPMSILWLVPQYMLVGLAEVFTSIGQIEFFYDQSPNALRSVCTAFALVTVSLGSYMSSFVLSLVSYFTTSGGKPGWIPDNLNEGRLDLFFWLISALSLLNLIVFLFCSSRYRYKTASV